MSVSGPDGTGKEACMTTERYRILRKLGEGGCGRTYLVRDRKLGKLWAMKEWKPEAEMEDGTGENSGEEEFRILRELDSPCFPRLVEYFWKDGKRYLVMDWVQGQTLEEKLIQDGPFGWREAADCALQLCGALEKLHGGKPAILHLDLKPSNIILTQDGPRLIDFGSAILAGERENESGKKRVPAITPGFAAPELYEDGKADAGSDVYSLGVVLQVMLTGKKPQAEPEKPEGVPEQLWKIAECALHGDRKKRFSDAGEMEKALESFLEKEEGKRSEKRWRRRAGFVLLGAVLSMLLCFPAVWNRGGRADSFPKGQEAGKEALCSGKRLAAFSQGSVWRMVRQEDEKGDCWASGTISKMRFEGQQETVGNFVEKCRRLSLVIRRILTKNAAVCPYNVPIPNRR